MKVYSRWLPTASLILAMMLWSSSFVAMKIAFQHYHPMAVIFGRMIIASICFLFFIPRFKGISYKKGNWKLILLMGMCEPCLYFIFEAKALENTTASQASMITSILPLMVAIGAGIFLKERISRQTFLGFVIAVFGVCWLSFGGKSTETAPNPVWGNFLEFIAMVCATGYVLTLKRLTANYSSFFLTGMQAFIGSIFFFPFLLLPSTTLPYKFDLFPALTVVYLGTCITLGAYGLYNYGVSKIPASQASAFVNLIPVFCIILAWLVLDEKFTSIQYVASSLVFIGVFLSQGDLRFKIDNLRLTEVLNRKS